MRVSDYVVHIPLRDPEKYILVHGYSGAVDVVSKSVIHHLQKFDKQAEATTLNCDTIDRLKRREYLTDKTEDEEEKFVCLLARALHSSRAGARAFLLIPTYNCQLRCPYCYELRLRTKGHEWLEKTMTKETVDAAFQAMHKLRPRHKKGEVINLYGGEPLLAQNREIVAYMVRCGIEHGYTFQCTSNGVDLEEYLDLLGPGKIELIQTTLDGVQEIHDERRFSEHYGTFAKITRNITSALRNGTHVTVRTNVDRENIGDLWRLARFYRDMSWDQKKNFHAYARPLHKWKPDQSISKLELFEIMAQQAQEHPELSIIENDFGIKRLFLGLIRTGKYPRLRPAYCGSNYGMYLFDPYGDVYLCWETVGTGGPHGKVGTYIPELSLDEKSVKEWQSRTVSNIPSCRKCAYALLCGGGCGEQAHCRYGSLASPSCEEFKELFRNIVPSVYAQWKRGQEASQIVSNN